MEREKYTPTPEEIEQAEPTKDLVMPQDKAKIKADYLFGKYENDIAKIISETLDDKEKEFTNWEEIRFRIRKDIPELDEALQYKKGDDMITLDWTEQEILGRLTTLWHEEQKRRRGDQKEK